MSVVSHPTNQIYTVNNLKNLFYIGFFLRERSLATLTDFAMTRGNQRDLAREKAAKKNAGKNKAANDQAANQGMTKEARMQR